MRELHLLLRRYYLDAFYVIIVNLWAWISRDSASLAWFRNILGGKCLHYPPFCLFQSNLYLPNFVTHRSTQHFKADDRPVSTGTICLLNAPLEYCNAHCLPNQQSSTQLWRTKIQKLTAFSRLVQGDIWPLGILCYRHIIRGDKNTSLFYHAVFSARKKEPVTTQTTDDLGGGTRRNQHSGGVRKERRARCLAHSRETVETKDTRDCQ